jgi:hypothetical protein
LCSVNAKSLKVVHQPVAWIWSRGRKDVIASPTVGTSQMTAMTSSPMWTGVRARKRTIRAETVADGLVADSAATLR